jgi:hypothetical protein
LSTKIPHIATLYQIATGTEYAEECTDHITANDEACTNKAIQSAFKEEGEALGHYVSHTLSKPNHLNKITVTITYIDFGETDTTEWELRPLKAFL